MAGKSNTGLFTADMLAEEGGGAGIFLENVTDALTTWVAMNEEQGCTIGNAAMVFNTTPEIIRQAADRSYWAYIIPDGSDPLADRIALDGE